MKLAQARRQTVWCDSKELENVFVFKYLGTLFSTDDLQQYDIKRRISLTMSRCGKLRHIFASPFISLYLKLRLYDAAVCSIFVYGCETWNLTEKVMCQLNGTNSS